MRSGLERVERLRLDEPRRVPTLRSGQALRLRPPMRLAAYAQDDGFVGGVKKSNRRFPPGMTTIEGRKATADFLRE